MTLIQAHHLSSSSWSLDEMQTDLTVHQSSRLPPATGLRWVSLCTLVCAEDGGDTDTYASQCVVCLWVDLMSKINKDWKEFWTWRARRGKPRTHKHTDTASSKVLLNTYCIRTYQSLTFSTLPCSSSHLLNWVLTSSIQQENAGEIRWDSKGRQLSFSLIRLVCMCGWMGGGGLNKGRVLFHTLHVPSSGETLCCQGEKSGLGVVNVRACATHTG